MNITIKTIDCIRIHYKLKLLQENPDEDPELWLPLDHSVIDLKTMTAKTSNKSMKDLYLVRGQANHRYRHPTYHLLKADAQNFNLKTT